MTEHTIMKNLPESERPYEKFLKYGEQSLSDAELLAIILKSGTQQATSLDIARKLLQGRHNNLLNLYECSFQDLTDIPGIGKVKAIQLKAVAELSKRIARTNSGYHLNMNMPSTIAEYYMEQMRHRREEVLVCAFFDGKCHFIGDDIISMGSVNFAYVSPRDIFRKALMHNAVLLILLHNHPSGDPTPSEDDIRITRRIAYNAAMLGIEMADHIIIGDKRYYSFKEHNQLET
uniref:RadC family protein n=1 Tax=Agathobacter sp. TaxID=2021311 RepID=UPI004056F0DF